MRILSVFMLLLLSACSNVPVTIQTAPEPNLQFDQLSGDTTAYQGQVVRWGGQVVKVENDNQGSTIHIAQFPLNSYGRPVIKEGNDGGGRFIARTGTFIDPAIYKQGTLITVVGPLQQNQTVFIDKKSMSVPVVNADDVYRWINQDYRRDPYYGNGYYYDPYYGRYYPGWRSSWRYYQGFYW